jgi:hypothetical protein
MQSLPTPKSELVPLLTDFITNSWGVCLVGNKTSLLYIQGEAKAAIWRQDSTNKLVIINSKTKNIVFLGLVLKWIRPFIPSSLPPSHRVNKRGKAPRSSILQ